MFGFDIASKARVACGALPGSPSLVRRGWPLGDDWSQCAILIQAQVAPLCYSGGQLQSVPFYAWSLGLGMLPVQFLE